MKGNLVIVESPAKAGTIQKFLGSDYIVKPSFGHIRDLQSSKLSVDVEHGFAPQYVIPADKKKVVTELKKLASGAQTVWLASDEDREGEAISWHLFQTLGLKEENTKRIVFHEITKNAILGAIENPRSIDTNLVDAQQARRVLDRLVGFELSPLLWRKIQPKLSAGRVQSVALRLVVDREKEIMGFCKEQYYKVDAIFTPEGTLTSVKATLNTKFRTEAEARKFLEDSIGAQFHVSSIEAKEGSRGPAAPFTTSTLQQEAARKLHFPVALTMRIAQGLYEKGLITYMRTDSMNLSKLALGAAKKFITENFGTDYSSPRQFHTKSKGAQEAHEAIRPTYIENASISGTPQEQKLYDLIWKRTIASQMADAKILKTDIKVASDRRPELFSVSATQILFDGFLKVYMEGTDDDNASEEEAILPAISEGCIMHAGRFTAACKFTAPPSRYSEAALVKKLEELGIGRPSTYATIITTLTTGRGYIVKGDKEGEKVEVRDLILDNAKISSSKRVETIGAERGKLLPQEIGIIVTDYLVANFGSIMDYDFTANVEKDFDKIADGDRLWSEVVGTFYEPFHKTVETALGDGQYSRVERSLGVDPKDGQPLTAKFGKFGPYIQKGEGEERKFAKLGPEQLIETITLEEALKLFELPRIVGTHEGVDIIATKGRFGPYLKYGDTNVSLPRGADPLKVSFEDCVKVITAAAQKGSAEPKILSQWQESDIQIIDGRYGPYIKHDGGNYRIPKGTDAATLSEQQCKDIISSTTPTGKSFRRKPAAKK